MRIIRNVFILIVSIWSGILSAQSNRGAFGNPTNTLEVQIKSTNSGDLTNLARVELFKGDMPMPATYANSRGEVTYVNLTDGSYGVRVTVPGYLPAEESAELSGGTTRHLIVLLHPDPNAIRGTTIAPEDPVVSARYLAAPEKARKELENAREARRKGDCKSAIAHGKKAVSIAPDFAVAYAETGMCQVLQNDLGSAKESFDLAIQKDPKFLYGYIGLANVEAKRKNWNDAAKALGLANKAQPDRAEPFYELARLQLETGHLDKAELAAKTALTKDSTRLPDLQFLLARIYVLQGKQQEAMNWLQEIANKNPDNEVGERARHSIEVLQKADQVKVKK
jgi:tetratricopeptide (TPR) repeat protein